MDYKNKFFMLGVVLIVFLSISCVCAAENETVLDDSSEILVSDNETVVEENYNAYFMADDFTEKYSP